MVIRRVFLKDPSALIRLSQGGSSPEEGQVEH